MKSETWVVYLEVYLKQENKALWQNFTFKSYTKWLSLLLWQKLHPWGTDPVTSWGPGCRLCPPNLCCPMGLIGYSWEPSPPACPDHGASSGCPKGPPSSSDSPPGKPKPWPAPNLPCHVSFPVWSLCIPWNIPCQQNPSAAALHGCEGWAHTPGWKGRHKLASLALTSLTGHLPAPAWPTAAACAALFAAALKIWSQYMANGEWSQRCDSK